MLKVLHVSPSFHPATYFGGPIYSTYALCNSLAARPDVDVRVLTTDTAGPRFADRLPIKTVPMRLPAGYEVYYCGRLFGVDVSPGLFVRLWKMIRWADVVHLTAVYSSPTIPTLLLCKLLKKPLVWSPRGSLQRWPGSTRTLAKGLWERVCDLLCERERVVLHVTSEEEGLESCERITRAQVSVIPNGIEIPETNGHRRSSPPEGVRLLFLGRLHPIKGIENLLHAVQNHSDKVTLSICGEGTNEYSRELKELVARLGLTNRVKFQGPVDIAEREQQLGEADLCVVPSFKENFCVVVAESLASGVPVIASRGTPWKKIEDLGCGLWVDNDAQSLSVAIGKALKMPLKEMGQRGRRWMSEEFAWPGIAAKTRAVYANLIADN